MQPAPQLLIFSRFPIPGQAKTRLIPALGSKGAARLHRRMTEHAVTMARSVLGKKPGTDTDIAVCYTGASRKHFRSWLGDDVKYISQPGGDLGTRMQQAFKTALQGDRQAAIIFGTDVPGITSDILLLAGSSLDDHDIVIGPATDGGYYLLGMKMVYPELFVNIDWGTKRVYSQTRKIIQDLGLLAAELPLLSDVDRPDDLAAIQDDPRFSDLFTAVKPMVSVIIPTLNEEAVLKRTLHRLQLASRVEIFVVDGGSSDNTRDIADQANVHVLTESGGRAAQLNKGASASRGRFLLFLHADTLVPEGYDDLIRSTLDNPTTVAGAFRFKTNAPGLAMQLVEWGTHFRSTVLQCPYDDQGLFLEKRVFNEMGGFTLLPIMEDFELVRRLRGRGTIITLHETAVTSARRWERLGILRTTLINQLMIAGFFLGVPVGVLTRLYRQK